MKYYCMLFIVVLCISISAKRIPPANISPVIVNGKKYVVQHWGKKTRYKQNGGIIAVYNAKTGKRIETILIYKINYSQFREADLQDVFIISIKLNKKKMILTIKDEHNQVYFLDLTTHKLVEP